MQIFVKNANFRQQCKSFVKNQYFQEKGQFTTQYPSDWWHTILNLSDIVAVSQNYCSRNNYERFADELINDPEKYTFARNWLQVAAKEHPDAVKNIDKFLNRKRPQKDKVEK